jgi:hypothetical protein
MLSGTQINLMIGPVEPMAVSSDVIDALQTIQVTRSAADHSGFQMTFELSVDSPLQTIFLLSGAASLPIIRVVVVATLNGGSEVLIDGMITNHEITSGKDGFATLTVTGDDLTSVMNLIPFDGLPYPAMPAEARVAVILAKYLFLGVTPVIIPSIMIDVPIPTDRIPRHQGTDLSYLRQLADDVGYVFYVSPGPMPGQSVAYWGPENKLTAPQPALNVNMDFETNVESLSFTFNNRKCGLPIVYIQEEYTKLPIPIPIPPITPLNPPLGAIPPIPTHIDPIDETAKDSPIAAVLIGLAKAARSADAVTGNGTLDVTRYGRLLHCGELVGVRGAGPAFEGLYYVKSVTHHIKRGEHKQDFTLTRNGLLSTVSRVPV